MSYNIMVMARTNGDKLSAILERNALRELFSKVKTVDSMADLSGFLDLFLTSEEKRLILRRVSILTLLRERRTYSSIKKSLKVSGDTISRVKDIAEKRGYGRNPNRKRVYSPRNYKIRERKLFRRYKGAESIV